MRPLNPPPKVVPKKNTYKTTDGLIRMIVTQMNQTLSSGQIAYMHQISRQWIIELAKRLRREGFRIPYSPPPRTKYTRAWKAIEKFKRYNPDLLKDPGLKATITIGDQSYVLTGAETRRLVGFLPRISEVQLPNPQPRFGFIPHARKEETP